MEPSDFADAVRAARDGEQGGYTVLWSQFSPRVAGFLRGRGEQDADDLTSQVFLDAFRCLDTFVGDERSFVALLFTIARRRSVDAHRIRGRRPRECLGWEAEHDERSTPSAEEAVLARAGRQWVVDVLAGLSSDQREVLLLRVLGDLTTEAVAAELGKSQGAVKALQRRGIDALRRSIQQPPPGAADAHREEAR